MRTEKLDRVLAACVITIAAFHTLAAAAFPVPARRPAAAVVALALLLMLVHATLYWFGGPVRERAGTLAYLLSQAALVFGVGLAGALFPAGVGLYIALTVQAVILNGTTSGTLVITLGALVLFAANAILVQDLYRGASAGLLLAVAAIVAHAIAAVLQRRPHPPVRVAAAPLPGAAGLTARELDVLRALTAGARNSEIAAGLGIAERTVKAHLASIYQKLGVESRGAAVATAQQRGLLHS